MKFLIAAIVFAALMLYPSLNSGWIHDDAFNSDISGTLARQNVSLIDLLHTGIVVWAKSGRFVPLNFILTFSLFDFMHGNLILYKSIIVVGVLINIIIYYYFIKLLSGSSAFATLSILLVPIFFQFRPTYADPILAFNLLLPFLFSCLLAAAILMIYYIKYRKNIYIVLSWLAYLSALLTYEVAYPFFIFQFLIAYFYQKDVLQSIKLTLPYAVLSFGAGFFVLLLRLTHKIPVVVNDGLTPVAAAYTLNINILTYIVTLVRQCFAAIPLSYSAAYFEHFTLGGAFVIVLFIILFMLISKIPPSAGIDLKFISIIGLALWILPGLMIATSPKYQDGLAWGLGYLPVYISYFGASLMVACFIYSLSGKSRKVMLSIAIILALAGGITYSTNENLIEDTNQYWKYPRAELENGLKNGLFKGVPNGSILLIKQNYIWDIPGFYLLYAGKNLKYIGSNNPFAQGYLAGFPEIKESYNFSPQDNIFYLDYTADYVFLKKVKSLAASNQSISSVAFWD